MGRKQIAGLSFLLAKAKLDVLAGLVPCARFARRVGRCPDCAAGADSASPSETAV